MRHRNILRKVSHAKFPLMAELDDTIRKNNLFSGSSSSCRY